MIRKVAIIASFPLFVLFARCVPFERFPSTCGFLRLTGYPCPTCGMTRSLSAICKLDFVHAIVLNPLSFVVIGLFALCWATATYEISTGRHSSLSRWAKPRITLLSILSLCILALFGLIRVLVLSIK